MVRRIARRGNRHCAPCGKSRRVKERTLRYTSVNLIYDPAALRMSPGHGFASSGNSQQIQENIPSVLCPSYRHE